MRPFIVGIGIGGVMGCLLATTPAWAQNPITSRTGDSPQKLPKSKNAAKTTLVEFEVLQESDAAAIYAQHWLKILGPLDVSLRIHRPTSNDKPEIKERTIGTLRYVTAIGTLDRNGKINFPDNSFAVGDANKLKDWITELRTYGAQGTPTGRPLWGLTKEQFAEIYEALVKPVEFETEGLPLDQFVSKLPLPNQFPLRWSPDAKTKLPQSADKIKIRQDLTGFSAATALAVGIGESRLGFRPNRTPGGDVELLIEPIPAKQELWPVGWPLQRQNFKAAPKLFAVSVIDLEDIELVDVLNAIATSADTPILVDDAELRAAKLDIEKMKVSFPRKNSNWNLALTRMLATQKLKHELWQDEAGRTFVWITTPRAVRAKDPDISTP
ncbi:hypothetical protein [Schlesneria paludicola]|uniref:hypothetical protein n=1 Tax=Schlesneria paludicola TaxID=360056 RepID=UPI00029A26C5|nr:hypothetical protein [Schlesneria paludicola]